MKLTVEAIGVLGPGLADWVQARPVLRGETILPDAVTVIPPASSLPPPERRRVGQSVRLAFAVAGQVFAQVDYAAAATATVFSSSGADSENCHALCESLAEPAPQLSPTRFTNSVHNAPAGYWSIAVGATASSTSLCAFEASFAAGLLEAAIHASCEQEPVALIAYDLPYPQPLHAVRPILAPFGAALILVGGHRPHGLAHIEFAGYQAGVPTRAGTAALEALRAGVPAARCLPLLELLANERPGELALEALPGQVLRIRVSPCR